MTMYHHGKFLNMVEWLEQPLVQCIAAAVVIIGVVVLLYRIYSLSKKNKAMSNPTNEDPKRSNQRQYDGMINGRPVTNSNQNLAPGMPFKKDEIGTEADLQHSSEPLVKDNVSESTGTDVDNATVVVANSTTILSAVPNVVPSSEPPKQKIDIKKFEPGIIFFYKTEKSETKSVHLNVVNTLIKEKIDELNFPNATIDTPYEILIDLSSKELTNLVGNVVLDSVHATPSLKDIGLTAESITSEQAGMKIKLWGTPKREFNEKLFFYVDFNRSKLTPEPQGNKQVLASFADLTQAFVHTKPFIINAHPRSLWKDLPVEDYEGYPNADNESNSETIEYVSAKNGTFGFGSRPAKAFEVIAASARGRSHAHIGKPRDDAFYFEFDKETGWNFVAVADGAGSAIYSRKGSELATQTVVKKLRETLSREFNQRCFGDKPVQLQRWKSEFLKANGKIPVETENEFVQNTQLDKVFHLAVDAAYRAIYDEHKQREGSVLKDYHTTLLCAAFRWFPELDNNNGGWFIVSYWIGDGGAAILRPVFDTKSDNKETTVAEKTFPKDRVFVLGEPDGGEFAGQTRFLTMSEEITAEKIRSRCRFSFCDSFEAMLLVSDGITDPFFPSEAAVGDEPRWLEFYETKLKTGCEEEKDGCKEIWQPIDTKLKAEALLKWLGFWSKGNHDDRTILIVKPVSNTNKAGS